MTSDSCGCFFPSFPILLHLIIADMVVIVQKVFQVIARTVNNDFKYNYFSDKGTIQQASSYYSK